MAIYLGNTRISPIIQGDTMEAYVRNGGRFGYSEITDFSLYVKADYTKTVTNLDYLFSYGIQETIPQMDYSSCTSLRYLCQGCSNLTSVPDIDAPNMTEAWAMFRYCAKLENAPKINAPKLLNLGEAFNGCTALKVVPSFDVSSVTSMANTFNNCPNLEEIHIKNIGVSFDISSSTKFTREALVEIIGNLKAVTTNRTLTMGATNLAKLTEADRAVATGKGWTLA